MFKMDYEGLKILIISHSLASIFIFSFSLINELTISGWCTHVQGSALTKTMWGKKKKHVKSLL